MVGTFRMTRVHSGDTLVFEFKKKPNKRLLKTFNEKIKWDVTVLRGKYDEVGVLFRK